ncbi:EspF repeat-containing protein [Promicromonospora sp. NPDC057138]|uniref:EspF repeat-containing protein n=1 Tax=Promicromonospora sp. NPDC057138 TaxID=3346031 RepID=UPI0036418496
MSSCSVRGHTPSPVRQRCRHSSPAPTWPRPLPTVRTSASRPCKVESGPGGASLVRPSVSIRRTVTIRSG